MTATGAVVPGAAVAREVIQERVRQDAVWGEQNHPDGTGLYQQQAAAENARRVCDMNAHRGKVSWADIRHLPHPAVRQEPVMVHNQTVDERDVPGCLSRVWGLCAGLLRRVDDNLAEIGD